MKNTFCPIPWNFQAIRANGDIRICCQANVTANQGVIRKPDGTAYNAGKDDLTESRNAELMKNVRVNMMNGVWSDECGRCKSEEDNGLTSRRSYENEQWRYNFDKVKRDTAADGTIDPEKFPIVYYDLRFGNFCNLKCRMCGPTDSNAWYEDWMALTGTNSFKDTSGQMEIVKTAKGLEVTAFNWVENEQFWVQLEANIHNIEHVYFAGGEPMLIERHYEFLDKCIAADAAKNIVIEYNTNMSTLPGKVTKLWTKFKQVRVGASVDGMGAVVEYQRYPVKWEKIHRNLLILDQLPSNIVGWLAFTVTVYNVTHMIDFMKWKLMESGFKKINSSARRPILTHHVAHHPKHLNIRVLPDEYKAEVTKKFEEFVEWAEASEFPKRIKSEAKIIANGVTNYMNSESYYDKHWKEFVEYTTKLDEIRGESFLDIVPDLEKYIK
jgi:sulfatase maturation enzyme AslB (radical SAM superfamily)